MNNVIFGSGVIGLIAKALLPSWTVIPFTRSRFFTYNPALDDNFIYYDKNIDQAIVDILQQPKPQTYIYKRAWDIDGQLVPTFDASLCHAWLAKIFGSLNIPTHSEAYFKNRMSLFIYDIRVNQLYSELMRRNLEELKKEVTKGKVTEIGDHYFVRNGIREEFDHAITTIPLNVMQQFTKITKHKLETKPIHYLHISTDKLNFEGNNQTMVTSPLLSFFKVTNIAPNRYLFYCHEEIPNAGPYLMQFIKNFDIIDGTSITDALTIGPIPKLDWLEALGIYSVGSYAQWDWCMDVGSCILRLVRYAQRGFAPFTPVKI